MRTWTEYVETLTFFYPTLRREVDLFQSGKTGIKDEPRPGQPPSADVAAVERLLIRRCQIHRGGDGVYV